MGCVTFRLESKRLKMDAFKRSFNKSSRCTFPTNIFLCSGTYCSSSCASVRHKELPFLVCSDANCSATGCVSLFFKLSKDLRNFNLIVVFYYLITIRQLNKLAGIFLSFLWNVRVQEEGKRGTGTTKECYVLASSIRDLMIVEFGVMQVSSVIIYSTCMC